MRRFVILLFAITAFVAAQEDGRSSKQFWMGFERGISQARAQVQKTLEDNLMTAMDRVSSLGHKIGSFSRRKEEVVPLEARRPSLSPEDAPIEAIEGRLGYDGLDDGLQVYFEGDSDQEELPEPHIIPSDRNNFASSPDDAEIVPPPRTGGPLFDLRFGFPYRFPIMFGPGKGPNIFYRPAKSTPWWQGDNVCIENFEENKPVDGKLDEPAMEGTVGDVPEDAEQEPPVETGRGLFVGHFSMHTCSEQKDKYHCTTVIRRRGVNRSTSKTYQCCHGFVRDTNGCVEVDMLPLPKALETLGLKNFLSLATTSKALEIFELGNMTLFVPSDEALLEYMIHNQTESNDINSLDKIPSEVTNIDESSVSEILSTLNRHAHEGIIYSHDFADEKIIPSLSSGSSLRINMYPQTRPSLMTVNCAPIVTTDRHYEQGVIHVLDRVIEPATQTMAQYIENDENLSYFKQLLVSGGLMEILNGKGQFTLLAPSNEAFSQMIDLETILSSSQCSPAIAKNHILPNTICSAAIASTAKAETWNILDNSFSIRYLKSGQIFFDDAQVVKKDIMTTNGVIHVIDKVLMPEEGYPASATLQKMNHTKFFELIKSAGLDYEIDHSNITIFAPTNTAIEEFPNITEIAADLQRLRLLLSFHITKEPFDHSSSFNNQMLDTVAGHPMRINFFRGPPIMSFTDLIRGPSAMMRITAACTPISREEIQACGGARIRMVNQVLEPPEMSILDRISSNPRFTLFNRLLRNSTLLETLKGEGPFTVLVPSDYVFMTLPHNEREEVLSDIHFRDELIRRHVVKGLVCCSGITPDSLFPMIQELQTLEGNSLSIERSYNGRLVAGSARITQCNMPDQNGIVHTVDKLFVEPHVPEVRFQWNHKDPMMMRVPLIPY